ncbi:MAG: AsmA-like C-terminal region-containing protein [Planctomycetota bacterium]
MRSGRGPLASRLLHLPLLMLLATATASELRITGDVLYARRISIAGLQLTDCIGEPAMQEGILRLRAQASCYGGRVTAELSYDPVSGDTTAVIRLRRSSLARLIAGLGASGVAASGLIDMDLRLHMPDGDWRRAEGQGRLELRHGTVLALPDIANLLLEQDSTAGLDHLRTTFLVADGRVLIQGLRLENPAVRVTGSGTIGLEGDLDLVFNPMARAGLLRRAPLVGWLAANAVRELTRGVVRVRVGGHISAPTFRTGW